MRTSWLKALVREAVQEVLEAEMDETLQAGKGERTSARRGYRSGHRGRTLVTRVGKLELRVPQDREGRFSTQVFERYQRSEKALVSAPYEFQINGQTTHCGVDVFSFAKIDGVWKVSNSMWTVEPNACAELRPGDSSTIRPLD